MRGKCGFLCGERDEERVEERREESGEVATGAICPSWKSEKHLFSPQLES